MCADARGVGGTRPKPDDAKTQTRHDMTKPQLLPQSEMYAISDRRPGRRVNRIYPTAQSSDRMRGLLPSPCERRAMPYLGPFQDRLEIRELQEMYADAVNQRDLQGWLALWAENGAWIVSGKQYAGRDAMAARWRDFYESYNLERGNLTRFFSSVPGSIIVEGEQATARVYLSLLIVSGISKETMHVYICDDHYVKSDGKWLLNRREARRIHPPFL
jgi:uncharacterized protein (TIGR02246 family)